jgi:nucleoside-diphosphate-sugar epimerase
MNDKVLILGISSFAGANFANYLLNHSNVRVFGTFNKRKKLPFKYFLKKIINLIKLSFIN